MFVSLILAASLSGSSLGQAPASAPATQPSGVAATQPAHGKASLPPNWPTSLNLLGLKAPTMTDDWFGLGPIGRDNGIDMKFFWQQHWMAIMDGGIKHGNKSDATMDWYLTADLDRMGLIPGGDILAQARAQWGGTAAGSQQNSVNRLTGATRQVNDDADGYRGIYMDQLWYRQRLLEGKIAIQIGHLDYQAIVDRNAYANNEDTQFMNEVLDNNPMFRTASQTGLGIATTIQPVKWYTLILGVGDADRTLYQTGFRTAFEGPARFYSYMEHNLSPQIPGPQGPLPGNYRFGMLYDPVPSGVWRAPGFEPETRGSDYGFYTSFDQMLFRENPNDKQGLGWFFRYAYRHGDKRNDSVFFDNFWSTGLAYTGLVPTRDKDTLGIAVAQLIRSPEYKALVNHNASDETYYELYYAIQVTPWCVVTPDIQYVDNPGGLERDSLSHVLVGGIRVRLSL